MSRTLHDEHRIHHQDAKGTKGFLCDVLAILVSWWLFWVGGVAETVSVEGARKRGPMISGDDPEIPWKKKISS